MLKSRRLFLSTLPAIGTGLSWTGVASALQSATGGLQDSHWRLVKRQFPLEDGLLYLNAANVCPASTLVLDRYLAFERDFHANPSFQNREKYKAMQEKLRGKLAAMLHASADEIAITRNTSEGTNAVVKGIDLKAGDEIVITDHNHPSNNDSWRVRAQRDGLVIRSAPVSIPAKSSTDLLDSIERLVTPKTRVIAVTHLTSTTGILYPVAEIARIARRRGAWFHVDGAQTFGALKVDVKQIGCDSYSGSAHKWMMGPLEAGVLYVSQANVPRLWPSIVTAGWSNDLKGARKFDVFGQRDDPRLAAFDAAVEFAGLLGVENIDARVRALAARLKQRLADTPGVKIRTNMEPALSAGVVKLLPGNLPLQQAYDTLWEKHRIAIAVTPAGDAAGLRFSPHIYNSMEEMDQAAAAVRELLG